MGRPQPGPGREVLPPQDHDGTSPVGVLRQPVPDGRDRDDVPISPHPDLAAQWAERTPPGFTFDIRAWSLLTGAPTLPDSLWPDLQDQVTDRYRDQRRLYSTHLAPDALDECWDRFAHALKPLAAAGKLGVVILQYPSWFSPRPETWAELADAGRRLPGYRLAVELRSPKWTVGDACDPTLEWLEERGLAYVCVDGPADGPRSGPGVAALRRTSRSSASSAAAGLKASRGHPPTGTSRRSWRTGFPGSRPWPSRAPRCTW